MGREWVGGSVESVGSPVSEEEDESGRVVEEEEGVVDCAVGAWLTGGKALETKGGRE